MPVLLSPLGALVGLAAVLPVAAAVVRERRLAGARRVLGLAPPGRSAYATAAAAAAAVALLALAAAQPALSRSGGVALRTDAQAYLVLDDSRSMAAVQTRGGPTRLERARALALGLRDALPRVPWGVASFNDRTLAHAFPTGDRREVADALTQSIGIQRPAPAFREQNATALGALASGSGFFGPHLRRRLFVLFTDGESRPFLPRAVTAQLRARHARLVLVRVWDPGERVYDAHGRDLGYRPDPAATARLAALPPLGVPVLPATQPDRVRREVARLLGTGPTASPHAERRLVDLAPGLVLAAVLPLGFVLVRTRR